MMYGGPGNLNHSDFLDAVNALWYLKDGDFKNSGLSFIGVVWDPATGAKHADEVVEGTGELAEQVWKRGDNLVDGMKLYTDDALDAAEDFLGQGYKDLGNGRYMSADGTKVVRMGDSDILGKHGGGSHMNFETLVPNPAKPGKMKVDTNLHIYLIGE